MRQGTFLGDLPLEKGEWEKWVDTSSPHALMVWKGHFSSELIKCVSYASDKECLDVRGWSEGVPRNLVEGSPSFGLSMLRQA